MSSHIFSQSEFEDEDDVESQSFHGGVYVLANRDNRRTYVGCAGISFFHRLRQHNREISGGAPGTRSSKTWYHRFLITGFRDTRHALSFEWFVKHYVWFPAGSFTREHRQDPVKRRRRQIELLFEKYGSTKFPNLTLHDNPNAGKLTCNCFDCLNKGQPSGEIGHRIRKITPTQKQNLTCTTTEKPTHHARSESRLDRRRQSTRPLPETQASGPQSLAASQSTQPRSLAGSQEEKEAEAGTQGFQRPIAQQESVAQPVAQQEPQSITQSVAQSVTQSVAQQEPQ